MGKNIRIFRSRIIIKENASLTVADGSTLKGCLIRLNNNAKMLVGSTCTISNQIIVDGTLCLGSNNYLMEESKILIENASSVKIGNNNRLFCTIWARFCGGAIIGDYNTINQQTEIRCDESVIIGDFNQISMSNRIWDTNTHRVFGNGTEYKKYIISHFPLFDEDGKPKTHPVKLGNCNWLGEYVFLKSSILGDHNVIGFRTSIINKVIDDNNTITNVLDYRIKKIGE